MSQSISGWHCNLRPKPHRPPTCNSSKQHSGRLKNWSMGITKMDKSGSGQGFVTFCDILWLASFWKSKSKVSAWKRKWQENKFLQIRDTLSTLFRMLTSFSPLVIAINQLQAWFCQPRVMLELWDLSAMHLLFLIAQWHRSQIFQSHVLWWTSERHGPLSLLQIRWTYQTLPGHAVCIDRLRLEKSFAEQQELLQQSAGFKGLLVSVLEGFLDENSEVEWKLWGG